MKKILTFALAVMLLFCMTGCADDASSNLVGAWEGKYATSPQGLVLDLNQMGFYASMNFNQDGSFTTSITNISSSDSSELSGNWRISDGIVFLDLDETILKGTLEDNKLIVDFTPIVRELGTVTYTK